MRYGEDKFCRQECSGGKVMIWQPGQALARLVKPAISREQLFEYAEASGDKNPIHLDDSFAKQGGFPSVIAHGMISMALLADLVRMHFPEDHYNTVRFKVRFRKVAFPSDQLTCEGNVKNVSAEGNIVVTLLAKNQNGEVITEGEAEVAHV